MTRFAPILILLLLLCCSAQADTVRHAAGQSASGTPGTVIAEVEAESGSTLVGWLVTARTNGATDGVTVTVTYTDDATSSYTSSANSSREVYANAGGIFESNSGAWIFQATDLTKQVTKLAVATAGEGTNNRSAAIVATETASEPTIHRDGGAPTGGATTKVAEITAGSGKVLRDWSVIANQSSAANTQTRVIVTYSDDATLTYDTSASTLALLLINPAGILHVNSRQYQAIQALDTEKSVKKVRVEKLGTSTSASRFAIASGIEADDSSGFLRATGTSTTGSGAAVASIAAQSGYRLDHALGFTAQTNAANNALTTSLAYLNSSPVTQSTSFNTTQGHVANHAGIWEFGSVDVTAGLNDTLTGMSVVTLGAGTDTRAAVLYGREELIPVTPPTVVDTGNRSRRKRN